MKKQKCRACTDKETCADVSKDGLYCTRERGHKGNHVACGDVNHHMATWMNGITKKGKTE